MSDKPRSDEPKQGALFDPLACPRCGQEVTTLQRVEMPMSRQVVQCCLSCLPTVRKERDRERSRHNRLLGR